MRHEREHAAAVAARHREYLAAVEREYDRRRAELVEAARAAALHDERFERFAIPADLAIPAFLRRRRGYDAGAEFRLAWAGIEGFTD